MKKALSTISHVSSMNYAERNARVLYTLSESGGGRKSEAFASARLALSFVCQRAWIAPGPLSNSGQSFARVLLALGEAGCGLALGQSCVGRLARHCVGSRARPKPLALLVLSVMKVGGF